MRQVVLKVVSLVAVAVIGVAAVPTVAAAQAPAVNVWELLNQVHEASRAEDYFSLNYILGRMDQSTNSSWTVMLEEGRTYKIVGVCDNDCSDLDLEVTQGGTVVGTDILPDDVPIVTFRATATGSYSIKVMMETCSSEPCYWGIVVLVK